MNLADLIDGYDVGKILYTGSRSTVYEATRESDGLAVVLKVYQGGSRDTENAKNEFYAIRACDHPRASQAIEMVACEVPVLVLRRIPGRTLAARLDEGPLSVEDVLRLGIELAEILECVHGARVVHRDVTPANVVLHADTQDAYLIDFDIAVPLGTATSDALTRKTSLGGTLPYLAPEQTGWVDKGWDWRTDLYTLGATLYHALTGRPPFVEEDANKLMHAHVAREPMAPHEVRPGVPQAVSQVLLKLLRKEPTERYPTAHALRADLEHLMSELRRSGRAPDDFVPCMQGAPDRPQFRADLYGREEVLRRLKQACAETQPGPPRVVLLQGRAGAGKTALMGALRPSIAAAGGYLAAGQFSVDADQPYSGWISALRSLTGQILLESDASFQRWRSALDEGLGNIAGALVDLVPDLACILPDTAPVPPLGPRQALDRLALAFERLIRVCSSFAKTLVILLDDLQWSDEGSRYLLRRITCSTGFGALLIIGSARKEELTSDHPLQGLLDELRQQSLEPEIVELPPLDPKAAHRMLADALGQSEEDVRPLAERVARATDNNPLLIREFIDHLHAQGLLQYADGRWSWEMEQIEASPVPDEVAALMAAKIDRLPRPSRRLLEIASCMADEFDVAHLSQVSDLDAATLEVALSDLTDAGLFIPCSGGFRFAHDRIRQAGRVRCSDDERAQHHLRIGLWLLKRHPGAAGSARVFELADHLNRAGERVPAELRWKLVELNLRAGQRALRSGASRDAAEYLGSAQQRFQVDDWDAHREIGFELHIEYAESLLQINEFTHALGLLEELDARRTSKIEFARIADKRLYIYMVTRPHEDSIRYMLDVFRQLGMRWPLHPSFLRTRFSLWRTYRQLRGQRFEDVLRPDPALDPDRLAPLLVLKSAATLLSRVDARLSAIVTTSIAQRMFRHGYAVPPAPILGSLAVWMQAFLNRDEWVRATADSALAFAERVPDPIYGPRAELQIVGLLQPWYSRRRRSLASIERVATLMSEVGDPQWEHYAKALGVLYRALCGDPVPDVHRELEDLFDRILRQGRRDLELGNFLRAYCLLSLDRPDPEAVEREARVYEDWVSENLNSAESVTRTTWLMVLCVYRRFDLAFASSEAVVQRLFHCFPFVHIADHMFYRGLAAAGLARQTSGLQRRRYLRALRRCRDHLVRWARSGPDFRPMALLLEAEQAALRGQTPRALQLYRDAALGSADQKFTHHVALAQEQRGRLLAQSGRHQEASRALEEAVQVYAGWGARAKAAALEAERGALSQQFAGRH